MIASEVGSESTMICGISMEPVVYGCDEEVIFEVDENAKESSDSDKGGVNVGGLKLIKGKIISGMVVVVEYVGCEVSVSLYFSMGDVVTVDESGIEVVVTMIEFCGGGVGIYEVTFLVSKLEVVGL